MTFEKDVELDSALTHGAAMHGAKGAILAGMHKGMTPVEVQARLQWLTKQSAVYCYKVEEAVKVIIEAERSKAIEASTG